VNKDEGVSCFLAHTSSLKRLRLILGDPGEQLPAEIRRVHIAPPALRPRQCLEPGHRREMCQDIGDTSGGRLWTRPGISSKPT
jgi:hypothetical protein